MRRRLRWSIALCIAVVLPVAGIVVRRDSERPLSALEARLVGAWMPDSGDLARCFRSDRSFSTTDGQYAGQWSIDGNRLTLTYWQPVRTLEAHRVGDFLSQLRMSRKTYSHTWGIRFCDGDQTLVLIYPEDHPHVPGSEWKLLRQSDE